MSQSKNLSYAFGALTLQNYESLNGARITDLGNPILPQDASTKNYVDTSIIGNNLSSGIGISITNNNINVIPSQIQITGLGNIQSGTWTANTIQIPYGGTGQTTFMANRLIYSSNNSLNAAQQLTFDQTIFNTSVPIFISNTSDITNLNDTNGSFIVSGGAFIKKQLHVLGNTNIEGNITVGSLTVNGSINLASINAVNATYTSITSSSINCSTINLLSYIVSPKVSSNNIIATNSTLVNLVCSNVNLTNIQSNNITTNNLISNQSLLNNINATNISTGLINSTNISTLNLVTTNISSNSIRSTFINSLNLINTYSTISNLVSSSIQSNNANIVSFNSTIANITTIVNTNFNSVNNTITNLLANNISSSNLSIINTVNSTSFSGGSMYLSSIINVPNTISTNIANINNTCTNSIIASASIGNIHVTGLSNISNVILNSATASNLFINNYLTSTFNTFVGVTVNNLNCTSLGFFSTIASNSLSTGTLFSSLSSNLVSTIGTLNVLNNINNSNGNIYSNTISASNIYSAQNLICNNAQLISTTIANLNVNAISIMGSILSTNLSTGSISVSGFITSLQNININQTNTNLINTNISSGSAKINTISVGNSYIVNNSVSNNNVINQTTINSSISSLVISYNAYFNKNIIVNGNYSGGVVASAGSFLNVLPSYYTNNSTTNGSASTFFANYIGASTLIASNLITTNKATNFYIQSNVTLGANQNINYNSSLALGYVNNNTGGNLNYQIAFERSDNNAYAGIYTENFTNKLTLVNGSLNSGLNIYTTVNSPLTLSNIPSSTNITPTPYIQFNTSTSIFYSTADATNITSASLVLQGGLAVNKNILSSGIAIGYQNTTPINGSTVIVNSNVSGLVLYLTSGITNLTITLPTGVIDGKLLFITTNQNITNVTLGNAVLSNTTLSGSLPGIRFIYVSNQNLWFSI